MRNYSLRYKLVLPFVLILLLVPAGIGLMLHDSGTTAVNTLTRRVLLDVVNHTNKSTEQHLDAALDLLNTFLPAPNQPGSRTAFSNGMGALQKRAWSMAPFLPQPGNYIYFGGTDGRFVGLYRISDYLLELYIRSPNDHRRSIYAIKQQNDHKAFLRHDNYDPRVRPWYVTATQHDGPVWSPVYNDFTSGRLTITVARPVRNRQQELLGVAAADIELWTLTKKLMSQSISRHGVAFVMDRKGRILAASNQNELASEGIGKTQLFHAGEVNHPLIRAAYRPVLEWRKNTKPEEPQLATEISSKNGILNIAAAPVGARQGVDWITVVVAPRSDFMGNFTRSFNRSLFAAGLCVAVVLFLGLLALDRVLRDIHALNNAARKIGLGENFPPLHIDRKDELGQLAQTFREMEQNLRTDKLTGSYNREYLLNRIRHLEEGPLTSPATPPRFAMLFIDLDNFKTINDAHGHDAGDSVLIEIASRLKNATRTSDIVTRYGGDEFVILLNETDNANAVAATEKKIRAIVEAPILINDQEIHVGFSIGWALFPEDGQDIDTLLKVADSRMFDEKKSRKTPR